jgi:hypothetical protein
VDADNADALDSVGKVINIVYINSIGTQADPNQDYGLTVNTPGVTQTSITLNYIISVGAGSVSHTMNLYPGASGFGGTSGGGISPDNWGMLISNAHGSGTNAQLYGYTIAHETGHILGFLHRAQPHPGGTPDRFAGDGLPTPAWNVMSDADTTNELTADDFDLAQAEALQYSNAITQSSP